MKSKYVRKMACSLIGCALMSLVLIHEVQADGTEQLGLPSIPIASGSQILVEGTGLKFTPTGFISIEIPSDVAIAQVLLYWTGRSRVDTDSGDTDIIMVNDQSVVGPRIGGPTLPPFPSNTYRADITELSSSQNWILAGQINELKVSGLDFTYQSDGAAVVVILDDGSMTDIQIMDGNDFAYQPHGYQTEPVEFSVTPSANSRIGYLSLIVTDVAYPRPAAVDVTVAGVTTRLEDIFQDNEGAYLDVIKLEVPLPAGASNVTVQVWSIVGAYQPASLAWTFVAWELPIPKEFDGCTYTIGYWKNHPKDWPTDELSLFTGDQAMDILWTAPKGGNAYIILAHQYIGAELNVANGTSIPEEVVHAWLNGQSILEKYQSEGSIPKKCKDRDLAIAIAKVLDNYNNGCIGPGHCD
ncbi:hypothetical protein [Pontiella sp.]|uniref:hypothetical protein n=1 Tax=Pontiella sp. TaxID=2837462 RepID=UPI003564818A